MNTISQLLLFIALTGPLPEPSGTLPLRLHLGRDRQSAMIRSELSRNGDYSVLKRWHIQQRYRLQVDDDEFDRPSYQIGRGDQRHRFVPGTFAASGTFLRTLQSLTELDAWEREEPIFVTSWADGISDIGDWQREQWLGGRPEVFPPLTVKFPLDLPLVRVP